MNDKDPPPFGYTFSTDLFDNPPSAYDNNGQSILSDMENQQLDNFFTSTNPFDLIDSQPMPPALDTKTSAHDYNNWEDFIAPPTVHRVTSTIPDQARLQNNFHDQQYPSSLHANFLGNTEDELQAATALFNQAQPSYTNGRSHSFHELSTASNGFAANSTHDLNLGTLPLSMPQHGLMHERLGSLVPNHNTQGLDTQYPSPWGATSKAPQQHQSEFGPPLQKLDLKRSYTFGTDNSFNSTFGYSVPNGIPNGESAARASIQDIEETSHHILRAVAGIQGPSTSPASYTHRPRDDDEQSDDAASDDDDDDRPAKKRKKSQARCSKDTPKKAARNGKARKASICEDNAKKKRASTAAQKTHRENLTEEQKRNNHILSEQKRRDLIKQGYKDLNEVVPAVRGGGLSKSQVLVEAAAFLEKLIEDNDDYRRKTG